MHFFIRKFWKSFSDFIGDFIIVAESFYKIFEDFQLQVFPIIRNWAQCNFIYLLYLYGWQRKI